MKKKNPSYIYDYLSIIIIFIKNQFISEFLQVDKPNI